MRLDTSALGGHPASPDLEIESSGAGTLNIVRVAFLEETHKSGHAPHFNALQSLQ
ncbi:hypothetical protein ACVIHI_009050 [Bradyrhizobium sp. USDA 4524]|nr:hypothetical protein [Bradyrhizobium sp. USDA 4538]MCP1907195.1 hypothetical protein [Bradyrhizobium sp. USDA 4537]MCP1985671.1 hypothetical protein [Bradyrhizobium sp. USDA 4539]